VNVLGACLQLTLTRWLLIRRGVLWAVVLPMVVNLALMLFAMVGGHAQFTVMGYALPYLAIVMIGSRGFMYGMTKPASDALYTRVPREMRYKGKNFVETAVWRLGDLLVTSGVSALEGFGIALGRIALIGAGAAVLATWVARKAATAPDLAPEEHGASVADAHAINEP
jgi:AAA family ATP:ADP antiporter